ncbi:MAG: hypothetical protein ACHQAU_02790 [Gammaproteobacteria bacterium]
MKQAPVRSGGSRGGKTASSATAAAKTKVAPSERGRKRRIAAILILILLLMLGCFWLGRATFEAPAPIAQPVVPVAPPPIVTTPAPAKATVSAAPAAMEVARPPVTAPAGITVAAGVPAMRSGPDTTLLEVSVGTTKRGGMTLVFNHPVSWTVKTAADDGHAELDVEGVRALGTFPRNLPLPPGVTVIHAGISLPDTLNLKFNLRPGIQAYTAPESGPASALNIYFRTPIEQAAAGDTMQNTQAVAPASGNCGGTNPTTAKAVTLLQQSLIKDPAYADVREALALLETCSGNGVQAEQLVAEGMDTAAGNGVRIVVVDAALLYARGESTDAVQTLKSNAPVKGDDAGYAELLADLEAASK